MTQVLLSDTDIRRLLGGNVTVLRYPDLYNYETLGDLLSEHGCAVILYEESTGMGHWVAVCEGEKEQEGVIYYFDSFGLPIDDPLAHIDPKFRVRDWEDYHYLSMMLANTPPGIEIDYNDHCLQDTRSNCCGRYAVMRCMYPMLSNDELAELLTPDATDPYRSPDELVVALTNKLAQKAGMGH
jgi:hypothetical protein